MSSFTRRVMTAGAVAVAASLTLAGCSLTASANGPE